MASAHDHLDALRTSIGHCRLALFVDLEAELVLSCSAARKPPQEDLDALAAAAKLALPGTDGAPDEALVLTPEQTVFFFRSSAERSEALCCVCLPRQDVEVLRAGAETALVRIGAAQV